MPRPFRFRRLFAAGAAVVIALSAASSGWAQTEPTRDSPLPRRFTLRPEITAQTGVVAAGRHYAVAAGMRMFELGGNAFDAGVAATFAAAVTEFNLFGFGGEAPCLLYDAKLKKVVAVSGQGPAPKAATPELYAHQGWVDGNGPHGATLPAVMDAMALILQHHGTLRLEQVLQPAIEFADGFVMYEYLHRALVSQRRNTERWGEASKNTYYPGGHVCATGEIFRQPNLAATLRRLVGAEQAARAATSDRVASIQAGRDEFYRGEVARRLVAAMQEAGGVMSYDDLATYAGRLEEPLRTTFHAYEVFKCGFWNQGPALLQTLNLLEGFDLAALGHGSAAYVHTVTEALKLAYADRNAYYGDPLFVTVPAQGLLSKDYAARRRELIAPTASLEHRPGDPYAFDPAPRPAQLYVPHPQGHVSGSAPGDTTSIQVADRAGNLFSCTPSSGWLAGGAFVAGDTGVPMSNRMTIFDLDPLSPNVLAGGKRPRTTLSPTIVFQNGRPLLGIGTPGGDNQDQQVLNVLLAMMVFHLGPQEAIEAPRFNSLHFHNSFRNHLDQPGVLEIENRHTPEVLAALAAQGHKLKVLGPWGVSTGVVIAAIRHDTGTLIGAADPRRERYAFGW